MNGLNTLVKTFLVLVTVAGFGAADAWAQNLPTVSLVLTATSGATTNPLIILENGGVMTVTAELDQASASVVSVTISVASAGQPSEPVDADDYTVSANRVLTFAANSTASTGAVTITAVDNDTDERTFKRLRVTAVVTTGNAQFAGFREFLIRDDEEAPTTTVVLTPEEIEEAGGGVCTVTATLSHPSEYGEVVYGVQVAVLRSGQGADSGDFTVSANRTLRIAEGSTTSTGLVTITAVDNDVDDPEPTKVMYVRVQRQEGVATYLTAWQPLVIIDDEDPPPPGADVDPGIDADMGSQLLFIADTGISARDYDGSEGMASGSVSDLLGATDATLKHFVSVTNTADGMAVTVLFQYHNDEMERVLWFLRVLRAGEGVLVDPFDHEIPGTEDEDGEGAANVKDYLFGKIPALSFTDENERYRPGFNSGRFVITVTAVAANSADDDRLPGDPAETANILFPDFLAEDLHGAHNIDAIGELGFQTAAQFAAEAEIQANADHEKESTAKNVGPLNVENYEPVAFNYLTGHHTTAQLFPDLGDSASWAVSALTRPAVTTARSREGVTHTLIGAAYTTLDGTDEARLAPKIHGGAERVNAATDDDNRADDSGSGSPTAVDPTASENNRVVDGGALIWPSPYRAAHQDQKVQFLSVADDYGDPGEYQLIAAKTLYRVVLLDTMGNALSEPLISEPVFGGSPEPEPPVSLNILVDGIGVMPNASVTDCRGNDRVEGWSLADLTDIVPSATGGTSDFAGLDTMTDPETNASMGSIQFQRAQVICTEDFGDGDPSDSSVEVPDGVPTQDKRSYIGGTLVVEKDAANRTFVTVGQVIVKYLTPKSAFGASWWLTQK